MAIQAAPPAFLAMEADLAERHRRVDGSALVFLGLTSGEVVRKEGK